MVGDDNKNNCHLQGLLMFSEHFLFFRLFLPQQYPREMGISSPSDRQGNEAEGGGVCGKWLLGIRQGCSHLWLSCVTLK